MEKPSHSKHTHRSKAKSLTERVNSQTQKMQKEHFSTQFRKKIGINLLVFSYILHKKNPKLYPTWKVDLRILHINYFSAENSYCTIATELSHVYTTWKSLDR